MRGRVGRRKCQTSAGSKSFAVENEGRECAFSALRQRSGVYQAEARNIFSLDLLPRRSFDFGLPFF